MRKRLWVLVLVLVLTIPLIFLLRDVVRELFVMEIWRMLWGLHIVFSSLPQLPLWMLFLATVLLIAVRSLGRKKTPLPEEVVRETEHEGRVQVLSRWIKRAGEGEYFKWSLAQHLGGLTWDVMAHRQRTTPEELRRGLRAGTLDLPPVVLAYLESAQYVTFSPSSGLLNRIWLRLRPDAQRFQTDPALEGVVQFLEDQLEA